MSKNTVFPAEATQTKTFEAARPLGGIRIGKVTYEHHTIEASNLGRQTLGKMVDSLIENTVREGGLINEFSIFFETQEQQSQIADIYRQNMLMAGAR
jgi:hypothetical protein